MKNSWLLVFLSFCVTHHVQAQVWQNLPMVQVIAKRITIEPADTLQLRPDSLYKPGLQITHLLDRQPGVYIKNYGPGNIATISVKGTGASHTPVIWKGIPIQNTMLGLSDLSLISGPVCLGGFLTTGSLSRPGVTENFGGVVVLGEGSEADHNFTTLGFGAGSFGNYQVEAISRVEIGKIKIGASVWRNQGENNYQYLFENQYKTQRHSRIRLHGTDFSVKARLNRQLTIETACWLQESDREIGPSVLEAHSDATQYDHNIRLSNRVEFQHQNTQIHAGYGFTQDRLNYTNPLISIKSESKIHQHTAWLEARHQPGNWYIASSIFGTQAKAYTQNYSEAGSLSKLTHSVETGYRADSLPLALKAQIQTIAFARSSVTKYAVLPSFSASYKLNSTWLVHASWSGKLRIPTLNDLFWTNLGNPSLKPESGYSTDAAITKSWDLNANFRLQTDLGVYQTRINDYIAWLPINQVWRPSNLSQVNINGFNLRQNAEIRLGDYRIITALTGSYIRSVQATKRFEGDEAFGKQLIYVPRWQAASQVSVSYKRWRLECSFAYTGKRSTTASGSEWLNGFYMVDAQLDYNHISVGKIRIMCFAAAKNLTGVSYQMVAGLPMPLQQFSAGLQFRFQHNKEKEK